MGAADSASVCPQGFLTITIHVAEVLSGCDAIATPPRGVQLENAIFTAAIWIVVHKRGVKATLIVCHTQPWDRESS